MNIAVISGGPSAERGISLQSAELVLEHLDPDRFTPRLVLLEEHGWFDHASGVRIQLNDFSLRLPGQYISFDFAFLMIHGTPAEDGKIQGYFEHLGISHSTCRTLSAALTFDKQKCKEFLMHHDVVMARSALVKDSEHLDQAQALSYPLFVKPNKNGSSYGISKVNSSEYLAEAVAKALQYDDEVIVEEFVAGIEIGAGVVSDGESLIALPLTEIVPNGEFFDYKAKYEGDSQEITPARIDDAQTRKCQEQAKQLYKVLDCRGVVRFDFIFSKDQFYLLEANTIPGMSPNSIIPQQARAHGWTITELLSTIIAGTLT